MAHFTWLQGVDQVPEHLKVLTEKFIELNPKIKIEWWDETSVRDEIDLREGAEAFDNAADYVPVDAVMQMKADIARYAIVREFGGLALDLDYQWRKPVDDLIKGTQVALGEETKNQWIACGFLASIPKHPLFTRLLAGIPDNLQSLAGKGYRANRLTGTQYLTRTVKEMGDRPEIRLLAPSVLHPVPWNKPELADDPDRYPDSYAVHLWSHQRGLKDASSQYRTW